MQIPCLRQAGSSRLLLGMTTGRVFQQAPLRGAGTLWREQCNHVNYVFIQYNITHAEEGTLLRRPCVEIGAKRHFDEPLGRQHVNGQSVTPKRDAEAQRFLPIQQK